MSVITELASDLFSKIQNQKISLKIKCLSLRCFLNRNAIIPFTLGAGENLQHVSERKSIKQANIKDITVSLSQEQQRLPFQRCISLRNTRKTQTGFHVS